ncbi:large subunit GTPase 1 homolog isoform X2 [Pomacea canaliculata]|uniref:large subunit GTPase 1 homolog isoform X2 n=1 Tax=Pomacea canaliculata TaxID=400727 RepID=UPI000D73A063|nr:large subunit GTPase 1 homolog isoform X2 [Pomacea canaliculata]
MGKRKGQAANMGKSIIRDRFRGKSSRSRTDGYVTDLHSQDLNDGYDWGRLNLRSVTEQSNLEDFLSTAELAGTEFIAEKMNIQILPSQNRSGVLDDDELNKIIQAQNEHRSLLRIPRRPTWDKNTTPEMLDSLEKNTFLQWRRQLASLEEKEHIVLTPFEKNLEFWRQLWRVIERSDVIVQIVDARNPLLFWCPDLDTYVKEVCPEKTNVLLMNKADYLTQQQRKLWADYFKEKGMTVVFWSALEETQRIEKEISEKRGLAEQKPIFDSFSDVQDTGINQKTEDTEKDKEEETESEVKDTKRKVENSESEGNDSEGEANDIEGEANDSEREANDIEGETNDSEEEASSHEDSFIGDEHEEPRLPTESALSSVQQSFTSSDPIEDDIVNGEQLLQILRKLALASHSPEHTTIGMVGYPNVGKSSTINAILRHKKVPVSATPGRTKHFQTLFVDHDLMLCDCPGLVFPSFISTTAELVVNGILPIDQLRDCVPPINLVCERIPKTVLEAVYGINLPVPGEAEDPNRPPTAGELLSSYGYMRGFMTQKGNPDGPRSARYILKDYVNGKLLYCHPPPGADAKLFQAPPPVKALRFLESANSSQESSVVKVSETWSDNKQVGQRLLF